jgi:hypothetical protein
LKNPDPEKPWLLETDASGFAIGAILSQEYDGNYHPVAFMSKTMTSAERNYPTHDQELLAVIRALEQWRHLLEGAKRPILIHTDNFALKHFATKAVPSPRQARWSDYLSRFDYEIKYVPGKLNKADGLSRRPDFETDLREEQTIIPLSRFINDISPLEAENFKKNLSVLQRMSWQIPFPPHVLKKLEDDRLGIRVHTDGTIRDVNDRVMVPEDVTLRNLLMRLHHESPLSGHPGIDKTLESLRREYFWDGMARDVAQYVKSCT